MRAERALKRLFRLPLLVIALVVILEEWLWDHLKAAIYAFLAKLPLARVKAAIVAWISGLPPYASLVLFIIPFLVLLPLKVLGIWCFARGLWILGLLDVLLAKVLGMAFTALVFELTKPKLMTLSWFRAVYSRVTEWIGWAHRLVEPVKVRLHVSMAMLRERLRPGKNDARFAKNGAVVSRYLRRARAAARASRLKDR